MSEQVNEFRGNFKDVMVVQELRGGFPTNIPFASGVDEAALIAEDRRLGIEPMYIILPIGKANVTSGNNRHYDEEFLQELERQTLEIKPVGLMGHLSTDERASAFPAEAVHWVGAARDGDTLWGKGYIPPGPVRDRIARYKAQGKSIATSIDAFAEGIWDKGLNAMRMVAKSLRLNQIDFAPADRAGIPDLAAIPMLTTEMGSDRETDTPQEDSVSREQIIQELRNARPAPKRGWMPSNANEVAELTAIREVLGLDESANMVAAITEMKQAQEQQAKAAIKSRISELVTDGIQMASVRGIVTELVSARNPQTAQEAETAFSEVIASESVSELLKSKLVATMGPRQTTPVQSQQGKAKYFPIPQEA